MFLTMLKSKLHRATVTQSDLHYEGSITIDRDLLDVSEILPYEQVDVLNINNGERFTTYAIEGERGSGTIGINGAAARLVQEGDLVIVCAYTQIEKEKSRNYNPTVILLDEDNKPKAA
ncbi:MAG: aspartate 1-decarboxylase [Alphaproteobacteria bacterium]|nr:aspartate 1-decarboxylase [Alphaproteobacteria bacterium]